MCQVIIMIRTPQKEILFTSNGLESSDCNPSCIIDYVEDAWSTECTGYQINEIAVLIFRYLKKFKDLAIHPSYHINPVEFLSYPIRHF